jgi:FeS assembly SUF system protein
MNDMSRTGDEIREPAGASNAPATVPASDQLTGLPGAGQSTPAGALPEGDTGHNVSSLQEKVLAAIKTVYDPEIPVDIYELGLIYEINVYPVNNVYIQMTLTSPSCPSAEVIPGEVQQKIKAIEGVNDVKVDVTFDPPYSQDMMSEAARLELGFM